MYSKFSNDRLSRTSLHLEDSRAPLKTPAFFDFDVASELPPSGKRLPGLHLGFKKKKGIIKRVSDDWFLPDGVASTTVGESIVGRDFLLQTHFS